MDKKMEQLLKKIEEETGLSLSVSSSFLSEEETLHKLKNLLKSYQANNNRKDFLRQFLCGQLSTEELGRGFHHFHIEEHSWRCLFLLEFNQPFDDMAITILSNLSSSHGDDILPMDSNHIALIRKSKAELPKEEIHQLASRILDTINTEALVAAKVSYDSSCETVGELPMMYQNASIALKIGSIFYSSASILSYHNLGLGKLFYQLPREVCETYLTENLHDFRLQDLDEESVHTIHTFFDCGLSIAECARRLFLHRNTLVYRLEKIKNATGLDIRMFDDAITCKIAMMVSDYLAQL